MSSNLSTEALNWIVPRVAASGETSPVAIYSTFDTSTPAFARRSACWLSQTMLPFCAAWSDYIGAQYCGALVSPKHVITAHHSRTGGWAGATLKFIDATDGVHTVTATQSYNIENTDIEVIQLATAVTGVPFVKVMPVDWIRFSPYSQVGNLTRFDTALTVIYPTYANLLYVGRLHSQQLDSNTGQYLNEFGPSLNSTLAGHYVEPYTGMSGMPIFTMYRGEPILLSTWYDTSNAPDIGSHSAAINTIMQAYGGYRLTMAKFPRYWSLSDELLPPRVL